jgi:hypothetical protein
MKVRSLRSSIRQVYKSKECRTKSNGSVEGGGSSEGKCTQQGEDVEVWGKDGGQSCGMRGRLKLDPTVAANRLYSALNRGRGGREKGERREWRRKGKGTSEWSVIYCSTGGTQSNRCDGTVVTDAQIWPNMLYLISRLRLPRLPHLSLATK